MKRSIVYLLCVSFLVFSASSVCWGQAYMDRGLGDSGCVDKWEQIELGKHLIGVSCGLGLGARVGYFFPYSNDNVRSDIAYEGIVTYAPSSVLAAALEVGYTRPEFLTPVWGNLELTYLNLTFELRGEPDPNFGIYLGFGPSLYFTDFDSRADYNLRSDNTFGANLSLGLDYFVIQHLALNIDVKYLWFPEDLKYKVDGVPQKKEKIDSLVFSAGLKYFF